MYLHINIMFHNLIIVIIRYSYVHETYWCKFILRQNDKIESVNLTK
jgi:hypothetical protein